MPQSIKKRLEFLFWKVIAERVGLEELSKSALQAGITVDLSRKLEAILGQLGASGKGLHEKATSVQHLLPAKLLSKLRYVASVRNKLSHDDVVLADAEFNQFVASARATLEELGQLATQPRPQSAARPVARPARTRSWLLPGAVALGVLVYLFSASRPGAPPPPAHVPAVAVARPDPVAPPAPAPALQQQSPAVATAPRPPGAARVRRPPAASAVASAPAAQPAASYETIRDLTKGL